jgi:hydrogenase maturation protein HypF
MKQSSRVIAEIPARGLRRCRLLVRGQVQGVGFRPYVYRLARDMGLAGHVSNTASGAMIEVQGAPASLDLFCDRLVRQLPPLARISELKREDIPLGEEQKFVIRHSDQAGAAEAHVTVDVATCDDCLREMFDPADRRYRYPFINCTNCGPRYTIVKGIPYDRPNTTMSVFPMCSLCRKEYEDPLDRRFHAQPIACPDCGPRVWLAGCDGRPIERGDAIREAAGMLRAGRILAIKGLGGFHLACLVDSDETVSLLRKRKHRDHKPFAMMARDLAQIEQVAEIPADARQALLSAERPIVLLPRKADSWISRLVAEGTRTYGIMLPYTPLHHLLFAEGLELLVMTSGNLRDEPICKDNDEALERLRGVADAFLLHDRDIRRRVDDSVVQARGDNLMILRRARGYVPTPVLLERPAGSDVLAVGPELKNTVCLLRSNQALLSEHVGDLTNAAAYRHFMGAIDCLKDLLQTTPAVVAHDLHPMYMSTQYARQLSGVRLVGVQHHFAHVVSCMAEHGLDEPVIGIAADGTGYGDDGAIWGCEILRAERTGYVRLGHLRYFPLPGGDAAARQACRPALALLYETVGTGAFETPFARSIDDALRNALREMLEREAGTVPTSSLGRLFDAAACLAGVASENHFEGQAPMALEAAIAADEEFYPHAILHHGRRFELDYRPMIGAMKADIDSGAPVGKIAARFHNSVVELLKAGALAARGLTDLRKVVLSGGCFVNRYLTDRLVRGLEQAGFEVYTHHMVPCNDGGVALGQAVHAAAVTADKVAVAGTIND